MTTLNDLVKQYGSLTSPPAAGDKVLFVKCDNAGTCTIYLAQVKEIKEQGEFKEPNATVRGLHMFFPDGSHKPYRGRIVWGGPISEFTKPITERLLEEIERLEKLTVQTRTWLSSMS